jgi:hypothetical protein
MSITKCNECGEIYDSDFQMCLDDEGNMICDDCYDGWVCKYWSEDGEPLTETCGLVYQRCSCCGQLEMCDYPEKLNKKRGI